MRPNTTSVAGTYPEDVPTPSSDDLTSIAEVVRKSTHHLPGFLLLIVGQEPFPQGPHSIRPEAYRIRQKTYGSQLA